MESEIQGLFSSNSLRSLKEHSTELLEEQEVELSLGFTPDLRAIRGRICIGFKFLDLERRKYGYCYC